MRCLIIDDEEISRTILSKLVNKTSQLSLTASCSSAIEALEITKTQEVDLVFLDVEMPRLSGLDFLKNITKNPLVIFVTSKEEYAVQAFEHDAVDYLLKPLDYPRFLKAIGKASDLFENKQAVQEGMNYLFVKKDGQLVKIRFSDILFVEAAADYMVIFTSKERFIVHITMKALIERLPSHQFMRVHRTYSVRLDKIESLEDNTLVVGKKNIPIGGSYKNKLLRSLNLL